MLRLICNKLSSLPVNSRASPFSHGLFVSNNFLRPMSEMSSSFTDPQNITVSYLQKSCGLPQNSAISVSKKLLIENSEKADSVLKLMRTHGLTQTHIKKIIGTRPSLLLGDLEHELRPNMELLECLGFSGASLGKLLSKEPRLLHCDVMDSVEFFRAHGFSDKHIAVLTMKRPSLLMFDANKVFKPKLDFFKSMGFADEDVVKILSSDPYILGRSLENHIIPCVRALRQFVGSDENVLKVVKAGNWILEYNLEKILEPNILIFKGYGVPKPIILKMFMIHPRTLLLKPQRIMEILPEIVKLGFNPNTVHFALAFRSMALISKTLWEQKMEAYRSFGLSEDRVYSAFKIQPMCMLISEKKIKKLMTFFINKLNIETSVICKNPSILMLSLEKRIISRCSVLQLLMSAGLLKEDVNIISYLQMTEKKFVEKLVKKYCQVLPDIGKAFEVFVFLGLISHAGSLTNLAKCPSSTFQIVAAAEKALLRALKTRGNTPKYALILHSPFIGQASARNKGRMASYLATRIQLHLERSYVNKLGSAGCLGFYNKAVAPRKTNDVMNARKLYKKGLAQLKIVP